MRRALRVAALWGFVSTAVFADVIYVDLNATGAADGTSWEDAFTDLQAALAAAVSGDEIWVAMGEYKPTSTTDRAISFVLENGVGVYGGFAGDETARDQRSLANLTVLSGDIGAAGMLADNSYHVVLVPGAVTLSGVLDGFVISGGRADGLAVDNNDRGGGMWINGGAPTLANLSFNGNFAIFEGGGLRVTSGAPSMNAIGFSSNSVAFGGAGGGMKSGAGSNVSCRNCVFRQNVVSGAVVGSGGVESAGGLTLVNCEIAQNNPSGVHLISDGNTLENCTIANNTAFGLALIASNGNTMTNSIVWGNGTAGIFNDGLSTLSVTYSDLQDGAGGTGNISANPLFVAPPGNLRLGPGSPAVDAGNNAAVPVGVTTDLAGLPRFFNDPSVPDTGAGTPPIVDMGAHERVPLTVSAPSSLDICEDSDAVFTVVASGQEPLSYAWRRDGVPLVNGGRISGADTATLTIVDTTVNDSGDYDVVVTDGVGQSVDSTDAVLTVHDTPGAPTITAPFSVEVGSTANGASVPTVPGSTWNWSLSGGTIVGGQGTNQLSFDAGAPGTSMLLSVTETNAGCTSPVASTVVQVDFLDVPPGDLFHDYVVAVARAGITAGCSGGNYCRNDPVTRAQMAVFLLKGKYGASYIPPVCQSVFQDVQCPSTFANWIEQLYAEQITSGCSASPLLYCPGDPVTRQQMAVFLLKTEHGSAYDPPDCEEVFDDVPCDNPFAEWIEQLYEEQVTGGCSASPLLYCPANPNTRGQMAVFLTKIFDLPLP
jgi:parallel beta-helix repeat protein